jgi:membrane-associated phospholipid phosphatase
MDIIQWLQSFQSPALTALVRGITALGSEQLFLVALPLLYWLWRKEEVRRLIFILLPVYFLGMTIKVLAHVPRPEGLRLADAVGYSFPSGHAFGSTVFWGFLATVVRRRWFTIFAIALVAAIALSRLYLGVHWPTDVAAGIAMSCAALFLFLALEPALLRAIEPISAGARCALLFVATAGLSGVSPGAHEVWILGLFMGMGGGAIIDSSFLGAWRLRGAWRAAVAVAVGFAGSAILWAAGTKLMPEQLALRYLQCALVGFWMTAGAPWLFLRLRLAQKAAA